MVVHVIVPIAVRQKCSVLLPEFAVFLVRRNILLHKEVWELLSGKNHDLAICYVALDFKFRVIDGLILLIDIPLYSNGNLVSPPVYPVGNSRHPEHEIDSPRECNGGQ